MADGRLYLANNEGGVPIYRAGPCPFFADGFESGDTSAWSSVTDHPR